MYEYLTGNLIEKSATRIILDVHGIGYEIRIPVSTFSRLPALQETVRILTHFVVREDTQFLCGFFTAEERDLFRNLISVSGIGPKLAMTILSGIKITELKQAIIQGSLPALTSISGIGKKIAERVIVELREKIALEEAQGPHQPGEILSVEEALVEDSLRALMELGYKRQSAKLAVQKALRESENTKHSVSDLIRISLKYV